MRVKAIRPGYHGTRRREGDEFEVTLKKGEKLGSWMVKVEAEKAKPKANESEAEDLV